MQESYPQLALREFLKLKGLADRAMQQVGDDDFFARLDPNDNGIALTVKHMAGNMHSRWRDFLTTDGEKPDRDRDGEFELRDGDTRGALMAQWESGWRALEDALAPLANDDLSTTVTIRGESLTVLQAVGRQLTHYAYHVGQIVLTAKHFCGDGWQTLSVPKGGSGAFNQKPARYLEDPGS